MTVSSSASMNHAMEPLKGKPHHRKSNEVMKMPSINQITVCGRSFESNATDIRPFATESHWTDVPFLISIVTEKAVISMIISTSVQ